MVYSPGLDGILNLCPLKARLTKCVLLLLILLIACKKETISPQNKIGEMVSHRSLGLAYLEEGRLTEAEAEFRTLTEIAPGEALGYADLALTYLRNGKTSEAEKQIEKALQISGAAEIRLIHAEILDRAGNVNGAIQELEKSVAQNPWHIQSQYKLVQLYGRAPSASTLAKMEAHLQRIVEGLQPICRHVCSSWKCFCEITSPCLP